jgi:hypothetical protein
MTCIGVVAKAMAGQGGWDTWLVGHAESVFLAGYLWVGYPSSVQKPRIASHRLFSISQSTVAISGATLRL